MNRLRHWLAAFVVAGTLAHVPAAYAQTRPTALVGGTVIDGTDQPPVPDAVVVMQGGTIVAVGSRSSTPVPRGAAVIDVTGRWIIPGLVDMHSHLAIGSWEQSSQGLRYRSDMTATKELAAAYPRFGITTIRNPAGPTTLAVDLRNRIRRGELQGPTVYTAGAPLDAVGQENAQVAVRDSAEVDREVTRQVAAGVDLIKLYAFLPPPVVAAAVLSAHRAGVPVLLHGFSTSWRGGVDAGVDGLAHLSPGTADLLPPARREEFTRSMRGTRYMFDWFRYADFADTALLAVIERMHARNVALDPTLVALEQLAWFDDSTYYPPAAGAVVPRSLRDAPSPMRLLTMGWTAADYASAKAQWGRMLAFLKLLADHGVRLTVGSDGANPWYYHRELELFEAAGVAPQRILQMATRDAAVVLGRTSEFGTIAVGRRADILVLSSDPLKSIRATRDILKVFQSGRAVPVDPCVRVTRGRCTPSTARDLLVRRF